VLGQVVDFVERDHDFYYVPEPWVSSAMGLV